MKANTPDSEKRRRPPPATVPTASGLVLRRADTIKPRRPIRRFWTCSADGRCITTRLGGYAYDVPVHEIDDAPTDGEAALRACDWIRQLMGKGWTSTDDDEVMVAELAEFLTARVLWRARR